MSVEMTLDINPQVQMDTEITVRIKDLVRLIEVSADITTGTSPSTVIASPGQTKQRSFSSSVPSGYTCIGYNSIQVTNITGGAVDGLMGNSAVVEFMNVGSVDIKPYGRRKQGSITYYYYTVKATLICVNNILLED